MSETQFFRAVGDYAEVEGKVCLVVTAPYQVVLNEGLNARAVLSTAITPSSIVPNIPLADFEATVQRAAKLLIELPASGALTAVYINSIRYEITDDYRLAQSQGPLHASAPVGFKCSDCAIDGEACLTCYTTWWRARHLNVNDGPGDGPWGGGFALSPYAPGLGITSPTNKEFVEAERGDVLSVHRPLTVDETAQGFGSVKGVQGSAVGVNYLAEIMPTPMLLHCPKCKTQHIDKPNASMNWTNPPHKTHLCAHCGNTWRPFDFHSYGVSKEELTRFLGTLSDDDWDQALSMANDIVNTPEAKTAFALEQLTADQFVKIGGQMNLWAKFLKEPTDTVDHVRLCFLDSHGTQYGDSIPWDQFLKVILNVCRIDVRLQDLLVSAFKNGYAVSVAIPPEDEREQAKWKAELARSEEYTLVPVSLLIDLRNYLEIGVGTATHEAEAMFVDRINEVLAAR